MKSLIWVLIITVIFWLVSITFAMKVVIAQDVTPPKQMTVDETVAYYASRYSVKEKTIRDIIKCESGWNTMAHNPHGENSYGLVQINLNAHPEITVEQATDPKYAIRYLAYHLSKGHGKMWTCYAKVV